jgi:hypothetical protein
MGMSSPASPAQPTSENASLLGGTAIRQDYISEYRRPWIRYLLYTYQATKATLRCSYANVFLFCVPLGIIGGALDWNPAAVFIFNFLAIFTLAAILSYATDELSAHVGQTVGGLINATFGNAVEMIVCRPCIMRLCLLVTDCLFP